MRTRVGIAVLFSEMLSALPVSAHIQLQSPAARYVQDNNGLKTGPCGSGKATGTVTNVRPGQPLTVTWKESVSHAGHFRIALSANVSDFVEPSDLTIPSPLPAWDLADGIPDKTGTQTYAQTVQIPNRECPACVLQLLQVMSSGTDGTNTGSFSGVYHACADLAITSGGGDGGSPRDGAAADARADAMGGGADSRSGRDSAGVSDDATVGGKEVAAEDGGRAAGAGGSTGTGSGTGTGGTRGEGGSTIAPGTGGAVAANGGDETGGTRSTGGTVGPGGSGGSPAQGAGGATSASVARGGIPGTRASGGAGGSASGTAGGSAGTTAHSAPPPADGCSCEMGKPRTARAPLTLLALGFALGLGRQRPSRRHGSTAQSTPCRQAIGPSGAPGS